MFCFIWTASKLFSKNEYWAQIKCQFVNSQITVTSIRISKLIHKRLTTLFIYYRMWLHATDTKYPNLSLTVVLSVRKIHAKTIFNLYIYISIFTMLDRQFRLKICPALVFYTFLLTRDFNDFVCLFSYLIILIWCGRRKKKVYHFQFSVNIQVQFLSIKREKKMYMEKLSVAMRKWTKER